MSDSDCSGNSETPYLIKIEELEIQLEEARYAWKYRHAWEYATNRWQKANDAIRGIEEFWRILVESSVGVPQVAVAVRLHIRAGGAALAIRADNLRMGHAHMFQPAWKSSTETGGRRGRDDFRTGASEMASPTAAIMVGAALVVVWETPVSSTKVPASARAGRKRSFMIFAGSCGARQRAFSRVWSGASLGL